MVGFSKYIISTEATVKEALVALNRLSDDILTLFVVDHRLKVLGTLTDGDIRRKLITGTILTDVVTSVMNSHFHSLKDGIYSVSDIKAYRAKGITLLPRLDEDGCLWSICNLKKNRSILPIDAVLMAGGKGERLRPLTEHTPKPLLKIGDKPIIDYNIDNLIRFGVENIHVTVNYLGNQIEKHFEIPREGIPIHCVREPEYLGTIGSLKIVGDFQHDVVLVMNSDLFTNIDFEDFFLHFQESNADMSVAAIPYSVSVPYGIFELDESDVKGILEKPTYNYYANSGIYLIKRELLNLIPDGLFFNATDFIEKLIVGGYHIVRFPLMGYWIDIGKPEDYKKAQDFVKHM